MTMMWIVISVMVITMILLATWLQEVNKKLDRKVENLETCLAKLSEAVASEREPELSIEQQIEGSKKQVMEELIKNITEYSPYGV